MTELRVLTWNVLHRIHAENWNEPPVAQFPDERVRIDRIAAFLVGQLDAGIDVVCLQEVSGDQLDRLSRALGQRAVLFSHGYSRMPKLRDPAVTMPAPLVDPSEHLVVLVAGPLGKDARRQAAATFDNDFGKGYLAVALRPGILVLATHITWGERGRVQLATVASLAAGPAVIAGDFNAEAAQIRSLLAPNAAGSDVLLSNLEGQRHTRVATNEKASHTIDHILVRHGTISDATVLPGEGLSDHNPVRATIAFPL